MMELEFVPTGETDVSERPSNGEAAIVVAKPRYWWFEDRPPGTIEGYALIVFSTLSAIWAIIVVGLGYGTELVLATVYALPVLLLVALGLAIRLLQLGESRIPLVPATLGIGFIAGGAILDLAATVAHSPTLDREANPVARALLDSGHALSSVYTYGFLSQALLVTTVCVLWLALLRHHERIVSATGPTRGFWEFLKAATGGGPLSWRQWLFPIRASEVPHPYHVFWIFVVTFLAGAVDRWFVALDWYGLVDPSLRWWVLTLGMTAGLLGYFTWLRNATRIA